MSEEEGRAAESAIILELDNEDPGQELPGNTYGLWFFVRTILVLIVVVALIWVFFLFLKRASGGTGDVDPYLKKVASLALSPGKFIYVVTLNSHCYVVGAADNAVSLIAEIDDKELVDAMNLNAEKQGGTASRLDFAALLDKFRFNFDEKKQAQSSTGFSASSMAESLKNQRSRLNRNDKGENGDVAP